MALVSIPWYRAGPLPHLDQSDVSVLVSQLFNKDVILDLFLVLSHISLSRFLYLILYDLAFSFGLLALNLRVFNIHLLYWTCLSFSTNLICIANLNKFM